MDILDGAGSGLYFHEGSTGIIKGGTFIGGTQDMQSGLDAYSFGSLIIDGGDFSGSTAGSFRNGKSLTINSGEFEGDKYGAFIYGSIRDITIHGGKFNAPVSEDSAALYYQTQDTYWEYSNSQGMILDEGYEFSYKPLITNENNYVFNEGLLSISYVSKEDNDSEENPSIPEDEANKKEDDTIKDDKNQNLGNNADTNKEESKKEESKKEENKKEEVKKEETKKEDTTKAGGTIPYTGGEFIIILSAIAVVGLGIYIYRKNKDLKGV